MSLDVSITGVEGAKRRMRLVGRLDSNTSPHFDERLDELLAEAVDDIVVDLEYLSYISSAGIGSLFRARKALLTRGGRIAIINPQPGVRKVFEIIKALPDLSVFSSERELDEYLDAMQRQALDETQS
jgi:anti-anti-sigma factor